MKILTISLNSWNDTQATGNTFSNLFCDLDDDIEISNIYCRQEPINNKICQKYFRVTEQDIFTSLFTSRACGIEVEYNYKQRGDEIVKPQQKSHFSQWIKHVYRPSALLFFRELIWLTGRWKSLQLDSFLERVSPDIIYMHGHNNRFMHDMLWYCQRKTGAKVAVFWGDDMYGIKKKGLGQLLYHLWLRSKLKYTILHADLLFGGSIKLCEEYGKLFNREFAPLFKTCINISMPPRYEEHNPIEIVYAGNLLYGRKEMLIEFADILREINKESIIKFVLRIYTANSISQSESKQLNDGKNTFFMGPRSYEEICDVLNNCDLSLFLESFSVKNIKQTRLSFSTKIIDYLQSSSALLVYGPLEIASIDYLKSADIAIVATDKEGMKNIIHNLSMNPSVIYTYALRKNEFAMKNHSQPQLVKLMREALN